MKTKEIEKFIKSKKKEDLQSLLLKLFDKGDEKLQKKIITAVVPKIHRKAKVVPPPNPKVFFEEVKRFEQHAEDQDYCAPNRYISKKQRSGWRFYVKELLEKILLLIKTGEHETAYKSLEIILTILDRGSQKYWIFVSGHAIDASKTEPKKWCKYCFHAFLEAHKYDYQKFFDHFIPLARKWDFNSNLYEDNAFLFLWDECATRDLKIMFFEALIRYGTEYFRPQRTAQIDDYKISVTLLDSNNIAIKVIQGDKVVKSCTKETRWSSGLEYERWYKKLPENVRLPLSEFYGQMAKLDDWSFSSRIKKFLFLGIGIFFQEGQPEKARQFLEALQLGLKEEKYLLALSYLLYKEEDFLKAYEANLQARLPYRERDDEEFEQNIKTKLMPLEKKEIEREVKQKMK